MNAAPVSPAFVYRLGRVPYREAWALQSRIQQRLIAAKRAGDAPLPHAVLVVEHPPVLTIGKSGDASHITASPARLAADGVELVEVDRGGDVTYHGPGQTVVYPILDLDRLHTPEGAPLRDLHRYLREMEEAVIRTCADGGVVADRVAGRTGVWVGLPASAGTGSRRGAERKVCAMGVRVSRWVTMHGLALNVTTDLSHFDLIVPCGIADRGVTSLERETGAPPDGAAVEARLLTHLADRLGLALTDASRAAASPLAAAEAHADGPATDS